MSEVTKGMIVFTLVATVGVAWTIHPYTLLPVFTAFVCGYFSRVNREA